VLGLGPSATEPKPAMHDFLLRTSTLWIIMIALALGGAAFFTWIDPPKPRTAYEVPRAAGTLSPEGLQNLTGRLAREAVAKGVPGIDVLVIRNGGVAARMATGERVAGSQVRVGPNDLWHIGSCAKAMTATMIARLAERGIVGLDDTMETLFPELAGGMNPVLGKATLAQLLSHSAGIRDPESLADVRYMTRGAKGVVAERAAIAKEILRTPPVVQPGTGFLYSNFGYVVAAAAAERATGKPWEELMREEVFVPLGMPSAGFGAPGASRPIDSTSAQSAPGGAGEIDQPRGHAMEAGRLTAAAPDAPQADNPAYLGPAGTVRLAMGDWARFAIDQAEGAHGRGKLLAPETYRRMQTPALAGGNYGLGWGVKRDAGAIPLVLTHNGSNGLWSADVHAYPQSGLIVLIAANRGDGTADAAVGALRKDLVDALDPKR